MAQDGRAVIAAIVAFTIIEFAQFVFADSTCSHCSDNIVVSPFRQYFRSIKDDLRSQSVVKANDQSKTGGLDPVKYCTKMCVMLAQDKLSKILLEKNLQESISKLSLWLKTLVKESFTVEEKTNSIRRKRQASLNYYDYYPPEYDQVYPPNEAQVMENMELWVNQADYQIHERDQKYDDAMERIYALPNARERNYQSDHGEPENPGPSSDCLAKQQQLFNDVLKLLDQITEKAIEQLRGMVREEVERDLRDMTELQLWWLISLHQNNFVLPLMSKEKIQAEEFLDTTETPEKSEDDVRPYTTGESSVRSTSRSSAMALAMSGPGEPTWYPFPIPSSPIWYPYQNMFYGQPSYSYGNPSSSQEWYPNESNPGRFVLALSMAPAQGAPFNVGEQPVYPQQTAEGVPVDFISPTRIPVVSMATPPQQPATEMVEPMFTKTVQANHDTPEMTSNLSETTLKLPKTTAKTPETSPRMPETITTITETTPKIPETPPTSSTTPETPPPTPKTLSTTPETPSTTPEISSGVPETTSTIPEITTMIRRPSEESSPAKSEPEKITFQYTSQTETSYQPEKTTEIGTSFASTTTEIGEADPTTELGEAVLTSDHKKEETTDSSNEVTIGLRSWGFSSKNKNVHLPSDCNNSSEMDHLIPVILEVFNLDAN